MKKILLLTFGIVAAFGTVARADDATTTISVTKASDTTAKVSTWPGLKNTTVVPISFASDASWDSVKDSYEVSSATACSLQSKTSAISVGSDGALSFHQTKRSSACKTKK